MPEKAPRIPDGIWDQHKQAIISFYSTNPLKRTMGYMLEQHGFQASTNQYTAKLKSWGIEKYHPGSDWAVIQSRKRKRDQEGKDSDVYIRDRKYTRQQVEKEIARHVPLGREGCSSASVLPDYITVCTPLAELSDPLGVYRDFLLRDLPWYQCILEIQATVSEGLRRSIAPSTPGASLERAMKDIVPQSNSDLPKLRVLHGFRGEYQNTINTYLPPEDLDTENSSTKMLKTPQDKSSISVVKIFLQRFIVLATNNLFDQWEFNKTCNWIVQKGGTDILVFLCRLKSPLMEVFAEKVFCSAVISGNLGLGRRLLQCGTGLHNRDPSQHQRWSEYLYKAVVHGHEAIVELLCKAGVEPEVRNAWPVNYDWDSRLPVIHTLLNFGADPERFITDKETGFPLIDAALKGSLGAVKMLLNRGARANNYIPLYYGTALQAAASQCHLEVVKYLIQHGADVDVPRVLPTWLYCWYGLFEEQTISLLTPVQIAAKTNNVDLLQALLQHGASAIACPASAWANLQSYSSCLIEESWSGPWKYGPHYNSRQLVYTALQYGVINQNLKIIVLLLSTGVPPDPRTAPAIFDTPLQMSARLGHVEIFRLLWSWGADVNARPAAYNGRTALQGAAESGNWEIFLMLLRTGAQVNAPAGAKRGMNALQAACLNGHSVIAGVLLAHGADVNTDPSPVGGLTPIQAASAHGDIGVVRDLIALGANVNDLATEGGVTALIAATKHKSLPLLELLVQYGADVNTTGDYGFLSPLREAARHCWLEGVHFLLEHGANVNDTPFGLANPEGSKKYAPQELSSPLGWAITNKSERMIDLLLEHGADVLATATSDGRAFRGALMQALHIERSITVIDLLLVKVPDLEEHPGWEDALKVVLTDSKDVGSIARLRIIEKVNSLPPLLRHQAIQKAWDALPTDDGGTDHEQKTLGSIDLLIRLGASLDSRALNGSTLFLRAALRGYEKSCTALIGHGAVVNDHATESWGTPLQEAIKGRCTNLVNSILGLGADINALPAKYCGTTALQAASINGMFELAVRLLERGAEVSAPPAPTHGRTAIDGAAERGRFDMVQLLLNAYGKGTDLEPIRRQAARYAEKERHFVLARWLRGDTAA